MRGEYHIFLAARSAIRGSPPLARGIRSNTKAAIAEAGITPACAGNTIHSGVSDGKAEDHPRLRGEYLNNTLFPTSTTGSPPLARGILDQQVFSALLQGITPACAGNTCPSWHPYPTDRDHPRLRGEYAKEQESIRTGLGSPPLARGIQLERRISEALAGITPACAGNTLKKSHIYSLFPISTSKFHLVSQTPEMS